MGRRLWWWSSSCLMTRWRRSRRLLRWNSRTGRILREERQSLGEYNSLQSQTLKWILMKYLTKLNFIYCKGSYNVLTHFLGLTQSLRWVWTWLELQWSYLMPLMGLSLKTHTGMVRKQNNYINIKVNYFRTWKHRTCKSCICRLKEETQRVIST